MTDQDTYSGSLLQQTHDALTTLHLDLGDEPAQGQFGDKTREAIKSFQRVRELQANGLLDPPTRVALLGKPDQPQRAASGPATGGN